MLAQQRDHLHRVPRGHHDGHVTPVFQQFGQSTATQCVVVHQHHSGSGGHVSSPDAKEFVGITNRTRVPPPSFLHTSM